MLKHHTTETQPQTTLLRESQCAVRQAAVETIETDGALGEQTRRTTGRDLLGVSGRRLAAAFGVPVLYGMVLLVLPVMPESFYRSGIGYMVVTAMGFWFPVISIGIGAWVQNRRLAALSGAWLAVMLCGVSWVITRLPEYQTVRWRHPLGGVPLNWQTWLIVLLAAAVSGAIGAAIGRATQRRRSHEVG